MVRVYSNGVAQTRLAAGVASISPPPMRVNAMRMALAKYEHETKTTMVRFECNRENRKPVIAGPKNPPRFPLAFMNPMEAARVERTLARVGKSHKPGCQEKAAAAVSESHANVRAGGWF